jgi:hypothetical protein
MTILKKLLHAIGFTSLTVWSTILLAVYLPTTGLLAMDSSGSINRLTIDLFRTCGFVASVACFVIVLEMLDIASLAKQKLTVIRTSLLDS